jgi:pimeloyl-ACP methyl ester carboxylesterase
MKTTNFITLPDGRKLAYAECGKPDGQPVIYFHGGGSSRLEPLLFDDLIHKFDFRLISPDRPGIGQSDPQPNRGFSDWPKDVVVLADTLGLDKFSVLGISSGGSYVFACAARIPERLLTAVIVSGAWDMDSLQDLPMFSRWIYNLSKTFPFLFEVVMKLALKPFQGSPEKLLVSFKKQLPAVDYAVIQSPQRLQAMRESTTEAMRQSIKNVALDILLYVRSWDFQAAEIQMPVKLFHGEQDNKVPISMARKVCDRLPTTQLTTYANEGHILPFHRKNIDGLSGKKLTQSQKQSIFF